MLQHLGQVIPQGTKCKHDFTVLWAWMGGTLDVELRGAAVGCAHVNRPRLAAGALEDTIGDPHLAVHLQCNASRTETWAHVLNDETVY